MKTTLLAVALSLLCVSASPVQNQPACDANTKGLAPQCLPGSHPVAECVCDGPSGPCHWVWHCKKD
jgi:hypothetical protein